MSCLGIFLKKYAVEFYWLLKRQDLCSSTNTEGRWERGGKRKRQLTQEREGWEREGGVSPRERASTREHTTDVYRISQTRLQRSDRDRHRQRDKERERERERELVTGTETQRQTQRQRQTQKDERVPNAITTLFLQE